MPKKFYFVALCFPLLSFAEECCDYCSSQIDFEFSMGYRDDTLRWGVSFSDGLEQVISKVKWTGMGIFEVAGQIKYESACHFYCRGSADYGAIFSGNNRNTEWIGIGDQTFPIANYKAAGRGGSVFDFSGGLGYAFNRCCCENSLSIIPLVGYAYNVQLLHSKHCKQELESEDFDCGCEDEGTLSGLKSRYSARWFGPWIGVDLTYEFCRWILLATAEYHWAWYRGKAHWNLRTDFIKDSRHHSFGHGQVYTLAGKYIYSCCWQFGVELGYQRFKTHGGHAKLFFVNETAKLHLNPVLWKSFNVLGSVTYTF